MSEEEDEFPLDAGPRGRKPAGKAAKTKKVRRRGACQSADEAGRAASRATVA